MRYLLIGGVDNGPVWVDGPGPDRVRICWMPFYPF